MKIPLKIVQMIKAKLLKSSSYTAKQIEEEIKEEPKKEIIEEIRKEKFENRNHIISEEDKISILFDDLKIDTIINEKYKDSLILIKTILKNIVDNPNNANYRKIKLTNKRLCEHILNYASGIDILKKVTLIFLFIILKKCGFEFYEDYIILEFNNTNIDLFTHLIDRIEATIISSINLFNYKINNILVETISFNPYQSFSISRQQGF